MEKSEWDQRYKTNDLVWGWEPNQLLVQEVEGMDPGRSLDMACGEGRNAIWLASQGWQSTGVDFSQEGLKKGKQLATEKGLSVDWIAADLREWQPPESAYDLIVSLYVHMPPPDLTRVHKKAIKALAPGGTILVIGHDLTNLTDGYGGPPFPEVLFTPEQIAEDFQELVIEKAERAKRTVSTDEGERTAIDTLVRVHRPA
ncbi:MAG: class I SAM-dependent methyltransferase [Actinobacteria bacterium]|nr:class I SAM-dependent methyltransferase [Actinomycetota bacterium]MCL5447165.1 class I SAM-dependent methyltransferase [Actinomycetota bacterium]